MSRYNILLILLMLFQVRGKAQGNLDAFLKDLNNKDCQIGFRTLPYSASTLTGSDSAGDTVKMLKPHGLVMSLDVDSLAALYPRDLLVRKLVPLLLDTTRDFYANAILYALFEREMPPLNTRANWVKTTRKEDLAYWNNYVKKKRNGP